MKPITRILLCTVIAVSMCVTAATHSSIRKQTEILITEGIPYEDIENANKAVARNSIYVVLVAGVLTFLTMFALFYRSISAIETMQKNARWEAQAYAQAQKDAETVDKLLHNIGNSINSVVIGIDTIRGNMMDRKLTRHFLSLASVVEKHQDDFGDYVENDPQGQKVAEFIIALANDFAKHDRELSKTANRVYDGAEKIANIIRETSRH